MGKVFRLLFCLVVFNFFMSSGLYLFDLKKNSNKKNISKFFKKIRCNFSKKENIVTDPIKLQKAAEYTLSFFKNKDENLNVIKPYFFDKNVFSMKKTEDTLKFIISTIKNDKKRGSKFRILDSNFFEEKF